ncbi:aminotransferase class I/II-fold pyridoxal phosphate-dependent enzyme [Lacticaseibacillus brantae]|uniref:Aspartate tyrosine aromatic aminotransferase n=1 Tax=Lacticaseibacillus brantae DSM 23927 TaxID=1423727 RepID=A0A0R2BAN8_9LACO|nr:aminotransferase class I/II-fold pyridoxal phosphate-dependent enzyme [Lacticaseibacillus brantae]KRM72675.1 aspartate tyrosine aromatic aminotransferase [Lacticaseibacillus brantae DSM 23927]
MRLAKRLLAIQPGFDLQQQIGAMKAAGQEVFDLTSDAPLAESTDFIHESAMASLQSNQADDSHGELWADLSMAILNQTGATSENLAIASGSHTLAAAALASLIEPGDEVLLPTPYPSNDLAQIQLAGGVARLVPAAPLVSVDDLEQARTVKTRVLMLTNPVVPTGAVYDRQALTLIGNWAVQHDIIVLANEMYANFVYNETTFVSMRELDSAIVDNSVILSGLPMLSGVSAWPIAFALGPKKLTQAMQTYIATTTQPVPGIVQAAAIGALQHESGAQTSRLNAQSNCLTLVETLAAIPGFELPIHPAGGIFLFARVKRAATLKQFATVDDLATALLADTGVAVVSGRNFGAPDFIRLNFTGDAAQLAEAGQRIQAFVTDTTI